MSVNEIAPLPTAVHCAASTLSPTLSALVAFLGSAQGAPKPHACLPPSAGNTQLQRELLLGQWRWGDPEVGLLLVRTKGWLPQDVPL